MFDQMLRMVRLDKESRAARQESNLDNSELATLETIQNLIDRDPQGWSFTDKPLQSLGTGTVSEFTYNSEKSTFVIGHLTEVLGSDISIYIGSSGGEGCYFGETENGERKIMVGDKASLIAKDLFERITNAKDPCSLSDAQLPPHDLRSV